jgi:hypothetical protein
MEGARYERACSYNAIVKGCCFLSDEIKLGRARLVPLGQEEYQQAVVLLAGLLAEAAARPGCRQQARRPRRQPTRSGRRKR